MVLQCRLQFFLVELEVLYFSSYLFKFVPTDTVGNPDLEYVNKWLTLNGNIPVQFDLKSFCSNLTCNWQHNQHLQLFHTSSNVIIRSSSPLGTVIAQPSNGGRWIEQRLLRRPKRHVIAVRLVSLIPLFFSPRLNLSFYLLIINTA